MQFKRTIKLILVAGFIAPMPLSAGSPTWGALGVPMQANGPLLERPSYSSFWVWHAADRNRQLRKAWSDKYGANGPPLSFLDDLSLDQFK